MCRRCQCRRRYRHCADVYLEGQRKRVRERDHRVDTEISLKQPYYAPDNNKWKQKP